MSRSRQLCLAVRKFVVRGDGYGDYECEAATPAAARWRAFKAAREAGYFRDEARAYDGFRRFLQHGFSVVERRRP